MTQTVLLRNPKALELPELSALIDRALEKSPWGIAAKGEVAGLVKNPKAGVVIAIENGVFTGLSITLLPTSKLDTTAQVIHIYSEGSKETRPALVKATVDFITQNGYNRFWAVNYSTIPDAKWMELMKPADWEIKPIGSVMDFTKCQAS